MFFDTKSLKTMEAGVQMTWMQQQLHLQNLANIETPGYKAKSLAFDDVLQNARKTGSVPDSIRAEIVTDENSSVLQDGNSVDLEAENIEYYKAYVQYSMLLDRISDQFENYSYVLNSNMN